MTADFVIIINNCINVSIAYDDLGDVEVNVFFFLIRVLNTALFCIDFQVHCDNNNISN